MIEAILIEVNRKVTFNTVDIEVLIEPMEKEKHLAHRMTVSYEVYTSGVFVNIKSSLTEHLHSVAVSRFDTNSINKTILKYLEDYDIKMTGYKNQGDMFPRMLDTSGNFV